MSLPDEQPLTPVERAMCDRLMRLIHVLVRASGLPRGVTASMLLGAAMAEARLAGMDINDVVKTLAEEWRACDARRR